MIELADFINAWVTIAQYVVEQGSEWQVDSIPLPNGRITGNTTVTKSSGGGVDTYTLVFETFEPSIG